MTSQEEHKLTIERLASNGKGLARLEGGRLVEVVGGLPGDELLAHVGNRKRQGVVKGFLRQVVTPSKERVKPRCPHVPYCGGCLWQQMDYTSQLQRKEAIVRSHFQDLIEAHQPTFHPILGCEDPWNYRNKMEFSFSQNAAGDRFLGLMLVGGNGRVMNLEECHLASPWFTDVLKSVRTWWEESDLAAYHHSQDKGHLRTLTLREAIQGQGKLAMLTVSGNPDFPLQATHIDGFKKAVQRISPAPLSLFLRVHQILKGTPTQFYEMPLTAHDHLIETLYLDRPLHFKVSPTSFFQPNTKQAQVLYSRAFKMLENLPQARVFDLYCGTATIAIALACQAKEVVGIEFNPHAIFDAKINQEHNGIQNLTLHQGDVGEVLQRLQASPDFQAPDIVVVDPPRMGLDEKALQNLIQLKPKQILYISCLPKTQAENIRVLAQNGYKLSQIQPVDQFPHTIHIENIAYLSTSGSH